jgi:ABC-type antimicrobial peptide transport system permease subunit
MHVVGIGAFPTLSDSLGLGRGGITTISTLLATLPKGQPHPQPDTVLVRFGPSVDRARATAKLTRRVGAKGNYAVLAAQRPVDLVNFGRVQNLPLVLATLLALFAALTLVHLLVTSIRRRRRDFAMLRALGFTARQLSGTVVALATTLVALALVVGVPLGLVLGRLLWRAFTHNLGILYRPVTPALAILLIVPLAVLVANIVAFASSRRLRHVDPATVLHAE